VTQAIKTILLAWGLVVVSSLAATELKSASITPDLLYQSLNGHHPPLLVDIRSPDEFSSGHIPGSVSIPLPLLTQRVDDLSKAADLVLYCNDSRLTRMAERILLRNKIDGFRHLGGGFKAWSEAQLPTETSFK